MSSVGGSQQASGWRIVIAGTGGQGVLTAARLLCDCFSQRGHDLVSGQLHGMAQRGGSVQSSVVIDGGISPVIAGGRADLVLGFEPLETVRALPLMSGRTVVYMNTSRVIPFILGQRAALKRAEAEYPDLKELSDSIRAVTDHLFAFDAAQSAEQTGSARTLNMVMLGCLMGSGALPCSAEEFWDAVVKKVPAALREQNTRAFFSGAYLGRNLPCRERVS